ncbi:unnamed protein product [Paramecium pentaurelia]|uniref:Uncharacterized protein n=1 Tax=Paramecium pentaurelia TaxID=43138 RepID=A0A8S1WE79_9CILI|nr:unnamed protein product [Paramecium pentaurelia]
MYSSNTKIDSKTQNRLIVCESIANDNSVIQLSQDKLSELKLFNGDIVLLEGKNKKQTVAIAIKNKQDNEKALINSVIRKNLGIKIGDFIIIYPTSSVPNLSKVHILPFYDQISGINERNIVQTHLVPYFKDAYRPVKKGDCFVINMVKEIEFKIIATEPEDIGVIGPTTIIYSEGGSIKREIENKEQYDTQGEDNNIINGYESIGGMNKQFAIIKTIVELQLKNPSILKASGLQTINGLLISGVSGSGKTSIVKALAIETGACIFFINGSEIISKKPEEAEEIVKKVFELAEKNKPAIVLIEDIDCIAIKKEDVKCQMDRRLFAQLITIMDHFKGIEKLIVIGTTNRPDSIDPTLKRFDRFDKEIELGIPNEDERMEIFKIHTKKMKLAQDIDLISIVKETKGFVGADIAALCKQSVLQCLSDKMDYLNIDDQQLDDRTKEIITVTNDNFKVALKTMKLSQLNSNSIEIPKLRWKDIGGLLNIKQQLQEIITLRRDHSKSLQQFGLKFSQNIILYGPPGCNKKSLAKALAGENSMNLIQIKQPLTSHYFKEIFNIAKYQQPCILLFDEFDQLFLKQRNPETQDTNLIQQFFSQLDDINYEYNLFFIGISNKLDNFEEYIRKNDRFDQIIYVGLPELKTRISEFKINLRNTPVSQNVDLVFLAQLTNWYSCYDIKNICQNAKIAAFKEMIDTQNKTKITPQQNQLQINSFPQITRKHFDISLKQTKRSLSIELIKQFLEFQNSIELQKKDNQEKFKYKWPETSQQTFQMELDEEDYV